MAKVSKTMTSASNMKAYGPLPDMEEDDVRGNLDYAKAAKLVLKVEMKRRDMSYQDLAEALGGIGVEESVANLRNKVSRGAFTAHFLLECMAAMRVPHLDLSILYEDGNRKQARRASTD